MDEEKLFSVLYFPQSKEKADKKLEKNFIRKEEDLKGFIDFEIERKPQTEDEEVKWPVYMNNFLKKNYALTAPIQKTPQIMNNLNRPMNQMMNNTLSPMLNNISINNLINLRNNTYNNNNNNNNNNNDSINNEKSEESSDSMHCSKDSHPTIAFTNSPNQITPTTPGHIVYDHHRIINSNTNSSLFNSENNNVNNNFDHSDHFHQSNNNNSEEKMNNEERNNNKRYTGQTLFKYGQNHNFSDSFHSKYSNIHLTKSDNLCNPFIQQLHKIDVGSNPLFQDLQSDDQSPKLKNDRNKRGYFLRDGIDGTDGVDGMNTKERKEKRIKSNKPRKKMGLDYLLN